MCHFFCLFSVREIFVAQKKVYKAEERIFVYLMTFVWASGLALLYSEERRATWKSPRTELHYRGLSLFCVISLITCVARGKIALPSFCCLFPSSNIYLPCSCRIQRNSRKHLESSRVGGLRLLPHKLMCMFLILPFAVASKVNLFCLGVFVWS